MKENIEKLSSIFRQMVENYHDRGMMWKNIPLAKEAFSIMKALPDTLEDEFDSPQEKAAILGQMLDHTDEYQTPRFSIEVREYMATLDPSDEDNARELAQLRDFINPDIELEEFCKKYQRHLLFDPVERTQLWEDIAYEVESQCDEKLRDVPRRMGFCFAMWHTRADVLKKYGIEWRSPSIMNPRVIFD